MSTHRHIQIHNLEDTMSSLFRTYRNAANNLRGIGNNVGADYYLARAFRVSKIADKCRIRLGV